MQFEDILQSIGKKIGVELSLDDTNSCALEIDSMRVTIQHLDELDMVSIYGEIGEPPPQGLETLLSSMLEANHLFQGTGGATISRNPESGNFFLCRCESILTMDGDSFFVALERFVNTLETWRKLLADYRPEIATDFRENLSAMSDNAFMQV